LQFELQVFIQIESSSGIQKVWSSDYVITVGTAVVCWPLQNHEILLEFFSNVK